MSKRVIYVIIYLYLISIVYADDFSHYVYQMNSSSDVRLESSLLKRLVSGFRINHVQNSLVEYYEMLYSKHPKVLKKMLTNATPYIYYILTQTERNGIPSEIALIPGIESLYNPSIRSNTNAFGLWQFMSSTGKRFKLQKLQGVDDRENIVKSTNAAILYFKYLYHIFGQWELAIGAYNCGEGCIYRSVVRFKRHLGNIDYYKLKLNKETMSYLPKLIALASILENPAKFNLRLNDIDNVPYFALVHQNQDVAIHDILLQSNITKTKFLLLNPQYKSVEYVITKNENFLLPMVNENNYYLYHNFAVDQVQPLANDFSDDYLLNFVNNHNSNEDELGNFIDTKIDKDQDNAVNHELELDKLINSLSMINGK